MEQVLKAIFLSNIPKGLSDDDCKFLCKLFVYGSNYVRNSYLIFSHFYFSVKKFFGPTALYKLDEKIHRVAACTVLKWFFSTIKLISKHLSVYWIDGVIRFISDEDVNELLTNCAIGTFLLQISDFRPDNNEAGISFIFKGADGVYAGYPISCRDLDSKPLKDHVVFWKDGHTLYPNIPKSVVFGVRPIRK